MCAMDGRSQPHQSRILYLRVSNNRIAVAKVLCPNIILHTVASLGWLSDQDQSLAYFRHHINSHNQGIIIAKHLQMLALLALVTHVG